MVLGCFVQGADIGPVGPCLCAFCITVGFLLMGTVRGPYKASRELCRQLDTVGALKTHIVLLIRLDFLVNSGPCRRTRGVTDCM